MKKIFLVLMFIPIFGIGLQAQRISAIGCYGNVTVYTDNGAYVKAINKASNNYSVKMAYTEQIIKDRDTTYNEENYSFSIAGNEERQLFYSSNKVVALSITSCEAELTAEEQAKVAKKEEALNRLRQR